MCACRARETFGWWGVRMHIVFDHLSHRVSVLADAVRRLDAFGFTLTRQVTPSSNGVEQSGTLQRSILFERGSIAVVTNPDHSGPESWSGAAPEFYGRHMLAFGVADAQAARAQIIANGLRVGDVTNVAYPIREPDIESTLQAQIFAAVDREASACALQWVQYLLPDLRRTPRLTRHVNGALSLVSVQIACEDDALAANQWCLQQCVAVPTHWDNPDDMLNAIGLPISVQAIPLRRLPRMIADSARRSPASNAVPLIAVREIEVIKRLAAEQRLIIEQMRAFHYVDLGGDCGVFGFFEPQD